MKLTWFKKASWLYLPVDGMGYLVTLMAMVFMVPLIMAIVRNGHSVSDDLYHIFICTTCTKFWWKWTAEKSK
ncbi:hypothetical protein BH11BAC3_BH11BAC3_12270 [soil metagenome]